MEVTNKEGEFDNDDNNNDPENNKNNKGKNVIEIIQAMDNNKKKNTIKNFEKCLITVQNYNNTQKNFTDFTEVKSGNR
mgnify:FL=1